MVKTTFENIGIEQVRDYWNSRPCNIRHSSREIGTKKYFDEVEAWKYFVEPHIPEFAEFSRWEGKKVLEIRQIGCKTFRGSDRMSCDLCIYKKIYSRLVKRIRNHKNES